MCVYSVWKGAFVLKVVVKMSFKPHNSCPYKKHVYPELWHLSYRCPLKSLLSGVGSADLLHSFSLCLNLWNTPVCVHTLPVGCTSTQRRETAAVIGVLNDCLLIFLPLLVSLAAPHVWTVNVTFICLLGPGSPADSLYWRFQRGLSLAQLPALCLWLTTLQVPPSCSRSDLW